jgi:hypothetical protein
MKLQQNVFLPLVIVFLLFSGKISAATEQTYICGKNNSLVLLEAPSATNSPREARFNAEDMKFCTREGNRLVYRSNSCERGNAVIRFDWVVGALLVNEISDQISLKCERRH